MGTFLIPAIHSQSEGTGTIEDSAAMLSNTTESTRVRMPAGGVSPSITLDFSRKTTGYLHLELSDCSHDSILIEYGPLPESLHVRKVLRMPQPGLPWVDDTYVACRYLRLTLLSETMQPMPAHMSIRRLGLVFSAYPCVWRGSFSSDDVMLDRIWKMGAYTVQLCMQQSTETSRNHFEDLPEANRKFIREWQSRYSPYVIFDGPRRDRETWLGDIRTEALSIYGAFGADEVVKSSLDVFLSLQRSDGTMPGCGGTFQEFKEYNLWWIVAIWECYLFTGDKEFLRRFHPGVERLLGWIEQAMDERGFIYNDGNWMWTLPREGYSSATQCILVHTLRCAASIETAVGNPEAAVLWEKRADRIREEIRSMFWHEEKGCFEDSLKLVGTEIPVMSDVNCYAITFGIADAAQTKRILAYLRANMWTPYGSATLDKRIENATLSPDVRSYGLLQFVKHDPHPEEKILEFMYPHNRMIWPFINGYEVEARFLAGDVEGAFELIRRCWGNMLDGGTGSFWECVDADTGAFTLHSLMPVSKMDCINSAAHGWSGWVSWLLQRYVLGVQPLEPGFRKVSVSPNPGALGRVSGAVPTPAGLISVTIESDDETLRIRIDRPVSVEICLDVKPDVLRGRRLVC